MLQDAILEQVKKRGLVTVDDIVKSTREPRGEIIRQMKKLAGEGKGDYRVGRRGHPSRFGTEAKTAPAPKPKKAKQKEIVIRITIPDGVEIS